MQILETPRLLLREFAPDDVGALARVLSDPETMPSAPIKPGLAKPSPGNIAIQTHTKSSIFNS
jgi:RimJ/RimL family protein N-acetyltransferase